MGKWGGVALGYSDESAPINSYRTPRAELGDWCRWIGEKEERFGRRIKRLARQRWGKEA